MEAPKSLNSQSPQMVWRPTAALPKKSGKKKNALFFLLCRKRTCSHEEARGARTEKRLPPLLGAIAAGWSKLLADPSIWLRQHRPSTTSSWVFLGHSFSSSMEHPSDSNGVTWFSEGSVTLSVGREGITSELSGRSMCFDKPERTSGSGQIVVSKIGRCKKNQTNSKYFSSDLSEQDKNSAPGSFLSQLGLLSRSTSFDPSKGQVKRCADLLRKPTRPPSSSKKPFSLTDPQAHGLDVIRLTQIHFDTEKWLH